MCKTPDSILNFSLGLEPIVFSLYSSIYGVGPISLAKRTLNCGREGAEDVSETGSSESLLSALSFPVKNAARAASWAEALGSGAATVLGVVQEGAANGPRASEGGPSSDPLSSCCIPEPTFTSLHSCNLRTTQAQSYQKIRALQSKQTIINGFQPALTSLHLCKLEKFIGSISLL